MSRLHFRFCDGVWWSRDEQGYWWKMPTYWKPGMSIKGFVWR